MRQLIVLIAATALLTDLRAQQAHQPGAPGTQQAVVAQQCLNDLNAFGERMDKDGFWLNGYVYRWAYGDPPGAVQDQGQHACRARGACRRDRAVLRPWYRAGNCFQQARASCKKSPETPVRAHQTIGDA